MTARSARALVRAPKTAQRGEVIEISAIVQHAMETGFRHTEQGQRIARDIIHTFECRYNGAEVFRAQLHPAIAANPLLTFFVVATESGRLEFRWSGDNGFVTTAESEIVVT